MALIWTQPLTEMITSRSSWCGKGGCYVGLKTLPPACASCLDNLTASNPGPLRACSVMHRVSFSTGRFLFPCVENVSGRWRFPFNSLVCFKRNFIISKTVQEFGKCETLLLTSRSPTRIFSSLSVTDLVDMCERTFTRSIMVVVVSWWSIFLTISALHCHYMLLT